MGQDRNVGTHVCSIHCISWTAVFTGALVAIGLGFLFNLFSLAVGLSAFPVTTEGKVAFAAGGFVGLVIIAVISMFISGWIAGFLGRPYCNKRKMGELYGFVTWALALVVTILLAGQFSQYVSQKSYIIDRTLPLQLSHEVLGNVTGERTNATTPPQVERTAESLGVTTFATFFILFIGALAATFGGRLGMRYRREDREFFAYSTR